MDGARWMGPDCVQKMTERYNLKHEQEVTEMLYIDSVYVYCVNICTHQPLYYTLLVRAGLKDVLKTWKHSSEMLVYIDMIASHSC